MNDDPFVNLDEVVQTIQSADVVVFRFAYLSQRLLLDYRSQEMDPPLVKVVPPAENAEERFRSLKQLRPRLRLPEKISAIHWPKMVGSLADRGVWDAIVGRVEEIGFPEAAEGYRGVLDELRELERQEAQHALQGEGYQALWER
jgi:hypothetical protein